MDHPAEKPDIPPAAPPHRDSLECVLAIGEDDRAWLARQLHDEAGQNLVACHLLVSELQRDKAAPPAVLQKLQAISLQVGNDLQRLAMAIRPLAREVDLATNVENYLLEWSTATSTDVSAHLPGITCRHPLLTEVTLYHLVQDALNWTEQRGLTRSVSILAEERERVLSVIIDGTGTGSAAAGTGSAPDDPVLQRMRARAALIEGTIEVERAPEHGATLFIRIPLRGGADGHVAG